MHMYTVGFNFLGVLLCSRVHLYTMIISYFLFYISIVYFIDLQFLVCMSVVFCTLKVLTPLHFQWVKESRDGQKSVILKIEINIVRGKIIVKSIHN